MAVGADEQLPAAVPVSAAGPHDEDREQEDPLLVTMGFVTRDEWMQLKAQPLSRFRETLLPRPPAGCYVCRHVYGRAARAHRLGSCYRLAGIDYGNFEHVAEAPTRVEVEKFLFCKRCFPSTFGECSSSEGSSSNAQDGRGTHECWVSRGNCLLICLGALWRTVAGMKRQVLRESFRLYKTVDSDRHTSQEFSCSLHSPPACIVPSRQRRGDDGDDEQRARGGRAYPERQRVRGGDV